MKKLANAWLINVRTEESYPLYTTDTKVGRGSKNDIVLLDETVSRDCAMLRYRRGVFVLYDVGSRSPILVNQFPLDEPRQLYHKDTIVLGDVWLRFISG